MDIAHQVTLVLIATASILLDRTLRYDLIEERLKFQLALWLALSLSMLQPSSVNKSIGFGTTEATDDAFKLVLFQTWLHLVVFSNIIYVCVQSWQTTSTWFVNRTHHSTTKISLLPPCAWIAMISSIPERTTDSHRSVLWTGQVFLVSLILSWIWQWHTERRKEITRQAEGIPNNASVHEPMGCLRRVYAQRRSSLILDESKWYEWNLSQTRQWVAHVLSLSGTNEDYCRATLQRLAPHHISGDILDSLTVECLVQVLQIPYNPAYRLTSAVQRLTQMYPKPRDEYYTSSTSPTTFSNPTWLQEEFTHEDWLTLHDREYNQPASHHYPKPTPPILSPGQQMAMPTIDPQQEERLAQIMKDRFGLELPRIQTPMHHNQTQQPTPLQQSIPPAMELSRQYEPNEPSMLPLQPRPQLQDLSTPYSATSAQESTYKGDVNNKEQDTKWPPPPPPPPTGEKSSKSTVPQALLDQMPENIREIATRRPDIVEMFLAKRTKEADTPVPEPQGLPQSIPPHHQQSHPMKGERKNYWQPSTINEVVYEQAEPEDIGDSETTRLIQRKRQPQYTNG